MKKTICIWLSIVFIILCGKINVNAANDMNDEDKRIDPFYQEYDTVYEYPITTNSEEWKDLKGHPEKIAVTAIPEDILNSMSTSMLLETVLKYPLLGDMFAWTTVDEGYLMLCKQFNGLSELVTRVDLEECLLQFDSNQISNWEMEEFEKKISLAALNVIKKHQDIDNNINTASPQWSRVYVYTPAGSAVAAVLGMTTALIEEYVDEETKEAYYAKAFPNAIKLRDATSDYNCHSYAWYSQSASNKYWIVNPGVYMIDGSYIQVATPYVGDVVMYENTTLLEPDRYVHSAIVSTVECVSKWGPYGLYRHSLEECPYSMESDRITYWRLDIQYADTAGERSE